MEEEKKSPGGVVEPPAIRNFVAETPRVLHGGSSTEVAIGRLLAPAMEGKRREVSLTRPVARGHRVLIGTDTPEAATHSLICMDGRLPFSGPIILGSLPFAEEIQDVMWIDDSRALVTVGKGEFHLISISPENAMTVVGGFPRLHSEPVREIAGDQQDPRRFISGSDDRTLCLVDLERPETFERIPMTGTVSSVAWPLCNQNVCPSATLDEGAFLIYDVRVRPTRTAAFSAKLPCKEIFAHVRYTDHNVVLGDGTGWLHHLDVRVTDRILQSVLDPYMVAIGNLEYNPSRNLLLAGGISDCTVWKHNPATGEAAIVARYQAGSGEAKVYTPKAYSPTFMGDDVIATSHDGAFKRIALAPQDLR